MLGVVRGVPGDRAPISIRIVILRISSERQEFASSSVQIFVARDPSNIVVRLVSRES